MVEAPGTAPGSDRFITTAVYRHSRLAPAATNIGAQGWRKKSKERRLQGEAGSPRPLERCVVMMLSTRPSATLAAAARHSGFRGSHSGVGLHPKTADFCRSCAAWACPCRLGLNFPPFLPLAHLDVLPVMP